MKDIKLSQTQEYVLRGAKIRFETEANPRYGYIEDQWFCATFTSRGSIEFFCRPQTARSLLSLGLLECRTIGIPYRDRRTREWRYTVQYRISQAGIEFLEAQKPAR